MRGEDRRIGALFSYVDLESRVRADHPLRAIREVVNAALAAMSFWRALGGGRRWAGSASAGGWEKWPAAWSAAGQSNREVQGHEWRLLGVS